MLRLQTLFARFMLAIFLAGSLFPIYVSADDVTAQISLEFIFAHVGNTCAKGGNAKGFITWSGTGNYAYLHPRFFVDGVDMQNFLSGNPALWIPEISQSTNNAYWQVEARSSDHQVLATGKTHVFSIDNDNPTFSTPSASLLNPSTAKITWTASSDKGCESLRGYRVFRNYKLIDSVGSGVREYTDSSAPTGTHRYTIVPYDTFFDPNDESSLRDFPYVDVSITQPVSSPSPSPQFTSQTSAKPNASSTPQKIRQTAEPKENVFASDPIIAQSIDSPAQSPEFTPNIAPGSVSETNEKKKSSFIWILPFSLLLFALVALTVVRLRRKKKSHEK